MPSVPQRMKGRVLFAFRLNWRSRMERGREDLVPSSQALPYPPRLLSLADNRQDGAGLRLVIHFIQHMVPRKADPAHALAVLGGSLLQPGKLLQLVRAAQQALTQVVSVPERGVFGNVFEQGRNVIVGRSAPLNTIHRAASHSVPGGWRELPPSSWWVGCRPWPLPPWRAPIPRVEPSVVSQK